MTLILFGHKGCGKTYYGKLLASALNWNHIDTDRLIEEAYSLEYGENLSCREIFLKYGERFFRSIESHVIATLSVSLPTVISLGGGALLQYENLPYLQKLGALVYLKAEKDVIKQRIFLQKAPSVVGEIPSLDTFEKNYLSRSHIYESISAIEVDICNKDDKEVISDLKSVCCNQC